MNGLTALMCLVLAQVPGIQVWTLSGEQHQGNLEEFTDKAVVVKTEDKTISVPRAEVLVLRTTAQPTASMNDAPIEVRLVDMTRLRVKSYTTSESTASSTAMASMGRVSVDQGQSDKEVPKLR